MGEKVEPNEELSEDVQCVQGSSIFEFFNSIWPLRGEGANANTVKRIQKFLYQLKITDKKETNQ